MQFKAKPSLLAETNPAIIQAKIPQKKTQESHQTNTLSEYSSKTLKQHNFLLQQNQFNPQKTKLTKAKTANTIKADNLYSK